MLHILPRFENNPRFSFIAVFLFVICFGCQQTNWTDSPPKGFQGTYSRVLEGVHPGDNKPIIMSIGDKLLTFNFDKNKEDKQTYPIRRVSKTGNHIVVFCGNENENHIADYRYEMFWGTDSMLYVSEIVSTGYDDEDRAFVVGKFTLNDSKSENN